MIVIEKINRINQPLTENFQADFDFFIFNQPLILFFYQTLIEKMIQIPFLRREGLLQIWFTSRNRTLTENFQADFGFIFQPDFA